MLDIDKKLNDDIDEFFYPQAHILRYFQIPNELYKYDINDFRKYYWGEEGKCIYTGNLENNILKYPYPRYKRNVIGGQAICGNIRIVLCQWEVNNHGLLSRDLFLLIDRNKELTTKKTIKKFGLNEDCFIRDE